MSFALKSRAAVSALAWGALLASAFPASVSAQGFDLGGTGAAGPLIITSDTVMTLPPSGVIQATRVHVAAGAKLSFTPNAANTSVTIVATGDVVIDGTISVDGLPGVVGAGGAGGPGGLPGGLPSNHSGIYAPPHPPHFCGNDLLEACEPLRGASGGRGSYPNNHIPANCVLGSGGGGGSGNLIIYSNTSISGSGLISAQGGAGGATKTSCNGNTSNSGPAQGGGAGIIALNAPELSLGAMTMNSWHLQLYTLEQKGNPPTMAGSNQITIRNSLLSWRPPPPISARITAINNQPIPPGESVTFTSSAPEFAVTVELTGCNRPQSEMGVVQKGGAINYVINWVHFPHPLGRTVISNPRPVETRVFDGLPNAVPGVTTTVKAYAQCSN